MDLSTIINGLTVTVIGVLTVFGVLAVLVIILYGLRYVYIREKTGKELEKTEIKEEQPRPKEFRIIEKTTQKQIHDPQLVSIITAAVLMFNEYKKERLKKYDIFRDLPELSRILGLVGIAFKAELVVSIGGKDQKVTVEEIPGNGYRVKIGNKEYIAQINVSG
ncbi:MAG: OadG family protein [Staphylothermus sp.]|nr:OadG family protein [Staphylothermus sp.]